MIIGAGALVYSKETHRALFLLRNNTKTRGTWGIPGGKIIESESIITGLHRELFEELGVNLSFTKYYPLDVYTSPDDKFKYYSFLLQIENEFLPILNNEHSGYCWTKIDKFPKPLHPGLFQSLNLQIIQEKIKIIEESL